MNLPRIHPPAILATALIALHALAPAGPAAAEDQTSLSLSLSRATLPNFLADPVALIPFGEPGGAGETTGSGGGPAPLEDAFLLDSPDSRFRAVWDPTACRLLGVIDLTQPDPASPAAGTSPDPEDQRGQKDQAQPEAEAARQARFPLLATGAAPFTLCEGAFGQPAYFGFRLAENRPEFLYRHGRVSVEESLRFSRDPEDQNTYLIQRFHYRDLGGAPLLTFPEAWKTLAETDSGDWQSTPVLKLPESETKTGAVEIRYPLPAEPGPESLSPPPPPGKSSPSHPGTASPPSVNAIAALDGSSALFLDGQQQLALARFSPELGLLGWETASPVLAPDSLPSLAAGRQHSAILASPRELVQAFPGETPPALAFFQTLARGGNGLDPGARITAGPASDPFGRILFALTPGPDSPGDSGHALMAWSPGSRKSVPFLGSSLPIADTAVSPRGLTATLLRHDGYQGGYYLSFNELEEPEESGEDGESPEASAGEEQEPHRGPRSSVAADGEQEQVSEKEKDGEKEKESGALPPDTTRPSVIVPAELTGGQPPRQIRFLAEGDREILLALSPGNRRLIEIRPEKRGDHWQGSVLVRAELDTVITALADMGGGRLLGGGPGGFAVLPATGDVFRISALRLGGEGIRLDFTRPLERSSGAHSAHYSIRTFGLHDGSRQDFEVGDPVLDSDGRSVFLPAEVPARDSVIVVTCAGLRSESGESLLENKAYFTKHR